MAWRSFAQLFVKVLIVLLPALVAIVMLTVLATRADAAVGVLAPAGVSADERAALLKRPGVSSLGNVFDAGEAAALRALGESELAASVKIFVSDAKAAGELLSWAAAHGIRLESNSVALKLENVEPLEHQQWALRNTGAPQKLGLDDLTTIEIPGAAGEDLGLTGAPEETGERVIVAVLDTGIDTNHPELKDQLVHKPGECAKLREYQICLKTEKPEVCDPRFASIDTDGNGYPLDCTGWNVTAGKNAITGIYGSSIMEDDLGHGTHVAGVIAAARNRIGVAGVARNVSILPVKIIKNSPNSPIRPQDTTPAPIEDPLPPSGERDLRWAAGFADVIARGMLYALRSNAQVINLSLAWPTRADSVLMRRMAALAQKKGVILVAAAGNDSTDSRVLPCLYPGVVCVAAHGPGGELSHFSNHGAFVDVAAPGLSILSTWPMDKRSTNFTALQGFELKNGTSMASPLVAGVVARLRGAGFSAEEAVARLLVGARGDAAAKDAPKRVRGGNVDLKRAFEAAPQPLILQAEKTVVKLSWDRASGELPVRFTLKNFWALAPRVTVTARVLGAGAALSQNEWSFDAWESGGTRELSSLILIQSASVEGRLQLELRVEAVNALPRVLYVPVELSVPVTPEFARDAEVETVLVEGAVISPQASLRSVTALDGKSGNDYLAIEEGLGGWKIQLLVDDGARYVVAAERKIEPPEGADLLVAQRLDLNQDGVSDLALVFRLPPEQGMPAPKFRFVYLDRGLRELLTLDHDNAVTVVDERFQWMRVKHLGRAWLAPAWVGFGTRPPLEKPAFDPWNPNPTDGPALRFYYLAPDGLRSVKAPESQSFLQLLIPSKQQRTAGTVSALLAQGDDYRLDYFSVGLREATLGPLLPLKLERYRNLLGLNDLQEALPLVPSASTASSTVFAGSVPRGGHRLTLLSGAFNSRDFTLAPPKRTDSVARVAGVFTSAAGAPIAIFSQTHYELQLTDVVSGATARTTLDRFSFLPAFIFSRMFFPVVIASASGARTAAVLVPASLGASDSIEVIAPLHDPATGVLSLTRPARLRLVAGRGCDDVGNPLPADALAPARQVFFCGDRLLRVPLQMR